MKQTVYIVEDHPSMLEALEMLIEEEADLELCGVAETAGKAIEELYELKPDLVLADLSLPGMNGIELTIQLLASRPEQRVLIISGHRDVALAEQALAAGAKEYILKGDPQDILDGIRRVLDDKVHPA